ncbi:MAG: universal stress protein [Deltaproteobacteria bacterium]|nr:universal stress protein [Deltaproteobacteria bacterium]
MSENENINKILIAVDGSDQSLQAVRYASLVMPCKHTEIVLFYIGDKFSQLFFDMDRNPLYQSKVPELKRWMADQQMQMANFFKVCSNILIKAGFPKDSVVVKTQTKKLSVSRDISKESYNDYTAVLMGRTGISKLKDMFVKSLATKLVGAISHIPIIVVGGIPSSKKVLMAFDGSHSALKGLINVGLALSHSECEIMMCHLVKAGKNIELQKEQIELDFKKAVEKIIDAGMTESAVQNKILTVYKSLAAGIVGEAVAGDYGTIVIGRRSLVTFIEEAVIGRVSNKVLDTASEMAVWIT